MGELQLRQDVLDELEFEPSVDAAHIGVSVDGGIVTLSGYVGSFSEKAAAVAAVQRVRGVRALADEIAVRFPSDKKMADDEIAKRAVDILGWDVRVPSRSIQVTVRHGLVTIAGEVNWYFQKLAAEEDVKKLSGIRAVVNNVEIRPHARAEDVRHKIEAALRRRAEIESERIRVSVRDDDTIVLEGSVDNWEEKSAVRIAAWSVPGGRMLEDRLEIS
jgi:osmotically-inducible protein OsmY